MAWLMVSFETDGQWAESWSDEVLARGALSVEITDAHADTDAEQAIFSEPGEISARSWPRQKIAALFDESINIQALLQETSLALTLPPPTVVIVTRVADRDWVRETQQQFTPICISNRLWIVPTWHQAPDAEAINLVLDPGLAFGTGSHPTTRLCLRWLEQNIRGGESIIDYGCGSGILAIAAAKLGAGEVTGVDIDPYAIIASRANAEQNQCHGDFMLASQLSIRGFDIVAANILANPLRVLAPLLCGLTAPGGKLVLAGLLSSQAEELSNLYAKWLEVVGIEEDEGWARLVCGRPKS
jgi:ribosomal protein L11 methyltransferase